ncbi:MAG: sugar ABC transporter permease [Anaerolineaceae bacterium]|nr:sugar ABC transporter permease [Anaerolineaceae bacterium]
MEDRSVRLRFKWLTDRRITFLFLAPTMLLLLAIAIFPLIWSLRLSFADWSVIGDAGTTPIADGFDNYQQVLGLGESASQQRLGREVVNRFAITGQFVLPAVGIELVLGFLLAMLLNRNFKGRGLLMTLMLIPMMLTPVVVTLFWRYIFRTDIGVLNFFIRLLGGSNVDWLNQIKVAPWALVLVDVWMWTPFMMLISLAGLTAVPQYLYEAADVDRASGWFKFRHITLPLVTPLLLIAILFRTMDAYKLFDQVWVLTGGGPGSSTQTMSFYLYQVAFNDFDTGLGSAIGYVMLIVIIALANILIRMLNQIKATE